MKKQILMPSAGQTTDEALVSAVLAEAGAHVKLGEILLEIETDKTVLPIESYIEGYILEIMVGVGDIVHKGDVLAIVGDKKDLDTYEGSSAKGSQESVDTGASGLTDNKTLFAKKEPTQNRNVRVLPSEEIKPRKKASPLAKKLAKDLGIDLNKIQLSDTKYVTREDVLNAVDTPKLETEVKKFEILDQNKYRKVTSQRMVYSQQSIPAFQISIEIEMSESDKLRALIEKELNVKPSYTDLILRAVAIASKSFPLIRSRYEADEIRVYDHINIGLAVSIDNGLIVPVLEEVDKLSISDISKHTNRLINHAKDGKLSTDDVKPANITVSNLGMYGVAFCSAIINPPESSILAIGSIQTKPFWKSTSFVPLPMMTITGSFDHRIMDGKYAAEFLVMLKKLLENPLLMVI